MRREDVIIDGKKRRYYYFKNNNNEEYRYNRLGISGLSRCIGDDLENGDEMCVSGGLLGGDEYLIVDDCKEAWEILSSILIRKNPQTLEEKCECVQEVINTFFGDLSHAHERASFYNESGVNLSSFAHKNMAACTERAILSHMMLKFIGIKSTFIMTDFINNEGNLDHHAYNLIDNDDNYYVYDSTQPSLNGDVICPLIAEIPREIYEGMKKSGKVGGIGLHIAHYNPMVKKEYDVVYNPGGSVYEVSEQKVNTFLTFTSNKPQ